MKNKGGFFWTSDTAVLGFCHLMANTARTDAARQLFQGLLQQEKVRLMRAQVLRPRREGTGGAAFN
jgi:hypothetical protein